MLSMLERKRQLLFGRSTIMDHGASHSNSTVGDVGAAVLVDELDSSLDGRIDKMEEIGFVLPKFKNLTY